MASVRSVRHRTYGLRVALVIVGGGRGRVACAEWSALRTGDFGRGTTLSSVGALVPCAASTLDFDFS